MLKLYRRLRPIDWFLLLLLVALTFGQVYFTMTMVDFVQGIIKAITFLDYHNHPAKLGEAIASLISASGWSAITPEFLALSGIGEETSDMLISIARATTGDIWYNGGMILLVALGSAFCQAVIGLIASFIASHLSTSVRTEVYEKVSDFSMNEINRFSTASLITRTTNDIQQVQIANIMMMRMVIAAPITAVWAILKIRASSAELTWATAIAVVIMLLSIILLVSVVMPKFKITQRLTDRLNSVSRENLTGIRVIRAYNAESYQEEKFGKVNEDITKIQLFTGRVIALMQPLMMLVMNGVSLAIYWIGSSLINKGTIEYATVTSFMMLASQIIMAFMMLLMMFILLPRARVSAERINEVLDAEISISDPEKEEEIKEKGTVEFKNVSFSYPGAEEPILKNISFRAEAGQTIAFIGATGSGKSTLIHLVPRFYDTSEGEVFVDGVNVRQLKKETLHRIVGYVPQKSVLFSGTVRENIAFGNPEMSEEAIVEAARIAEADGFIRGMERGYDSQISQGGKNVSGGQKQRISIARAVAADPEIFIFDDSFSALDYKTDKQVRENLKEKASGTTKLIVAQRIGTIMDADRIIVLEHGVSVGSGTHQELLETCPAYREIALSQLSKEELGL